MDRTSSDIALLLARITFAALFAASGLRKLMDLPTFAASLVKRGVPYADALAPIGAGVEFLAGALVLIGFQTRFAALALVLFTVIATFIGHRFWEFDGPARQQQQSHFFKNLAILGGLLALWVAGGGRYALDRLWGPRADR